MAQHEDEWVWGWDSTPGIVSVWAEIDGRATLWRRIPGMGQLVRISDDAVAVLLRYRWPGNIRELKNIIQSTLVYLSNPVIRTENLPDFFLRKAAAAGEPSPSERTRILAVLEQTRWNKSRAAESLSWSRMTLYRKMVKYQLGAAPSVRKVSA